MLISHLPPAVEISRLRRLKEAVFGGKSKPHPAIAATNEWSAEVDARLTELERAMLPSFRARS